MKAVIGKPSIDVLENLGSKVGQVKEKKFNRIAIKADP
jgi:hypothetical protein